MVTPKRWLATLLLLTASCAHAGRSGDAQPRVANNPNVISLRELRDPVIAGMDALKAIRFLRPNFFRTTGPQSFVNTEAGKVHYSLDYGPVRPVSELETLTTVMIVEIRYLNANDAHNRFGLNANGGPVIVLLNNKAP